MIDLGEKTRKRGLHVRRVEGRRLDEGELVSRGVRPRLVRGHGAQMAHVALVAHQHDHDVLVSAVAEILQPFPYVPVRPVLRDVVNEKGALCATIVRRSNPKKQTSAHCKCENSLTAR